MKVTHIDAFDGNQLIEIEKLTVDNAADRVSIYGELNITRDEVGLNNAQKLFDVLSAIVKKLETEKSRGELPEFLSIKASSTEINPFFGK